MKTININTMVYSMENIDTAIEAYADIAVINKVENGVYATLEFSECKYDESRTINEFENYLIGIENL